MKRDHSSLNSLLDRLLNGDQHRQSIMYAIVKNISLIIDETFFFDAGEMATMIFQRDKSMH
jgi:hypothetical protein